MPAETATATKLHRSSGTLRATPPFDFAKSLEFVERFSPAHGEQVVEDGTLSKALRVRGRTIAFEVRAADRSPPDGVAFRLLAEAPVSPALRKEIGARISSYLSLEDDLEPFYRLGRADRAFAPRLRRLHGLHQVKFLTPFENACWAVLAQRIPMPVARSLKQMLVQELGGSIQLGGATLAAFPEPEDVLAANGRVGSIIRNQRKARYVIAVAEAFAEVDERFLMEGDLDQVQSWLRSIEGIGEWSAAFVLFRGLGRIDRMPLTAPFLESVRAVYGARLTDREVAGISERYGPWAGYWSMYLRVGFEDRGGSPR